MTGTVCDGVTTATENNRYKWNIKCRTSYEEGVQARLASSTPGSNPHPAGTREAQSWDAGVSDAAAGTIAACSAYRGQTGPVAQTIDLAQLATWMQSEGWAATNTGNVSIQIEGETYTQTFLQACDYSTVLPVPKRVDLEQGVQMQGFCT